MLHAANSSQWMFEMGLVAITRVAELMFLVRTVGTNLGPFLGGEF